MLDDDDVRHEPGLVGDRTDLRAGDPDRLDLAVERDVELVGLKPRARLGQLDRAADQRPPSIRFTMATEPIGMSALAFGKNAFTTFLMTGVGGFASESVIGWRRVYLAPYPRPTDPAPCYPSPSSRRRQCAGSRCRWSTA